MTHPRRRSRRPWKVTLAATPALVLAGCAGALAPFDGPASVYRAAREAIADRPAIVPADRMLADAELVAVPYTVGTRLRRDTVRGAGEDDIYQTGSSVRLGGATLAVGFEWAH